MKLSHKAFILVSVPLIFELVLVSMLVYFNEQVQLERAREAHARDIAASINIIIKYNLEFSIFMAMSHSMPEMEARSFDARTRMWSEVKTLNQLVQDRAEEKTSFDRILKLIEEMNRSYRRIQSYQASKNKIAEAATWFKYLGAADEVFKTADLLQGKNTKEILERKERIDRFEHLLHVSALVLIVGNVAIAFGLAASFNATTSRRLLLLMDTANRLAAGQAPKYNLGGHDELTQLDDVFHQLHGALSLLRRRERAILENAVEVICSLDKDLKFAELNQAVNRLWGYLPDDLIGARVAEVLAAEARQLVAEKLETAKASNANSEITFEAPITKHGGGRAESAWSVNWSQEDQAFYCVIHDVTERKKLDALKREFVAIVSHDLRTPLTNVQLIHELVDDEAREKLSHDSYAELSSVRDNVSRLIALINNLLDLEKLESGNMDVEPVQRELAPVVTESISALKSIGKGKKIQLVNTVDEQLEAYFDRERILQVLVNFLSNALKYSPPSSTIEITAETQGDFIRVSVNDQGPGIPEAVIATIFERFKQASRDDERIHKGSGLGLAICKQIVESHCGSIGVDSKPGEGSKFWFTLPASEEVQRKSKVN